MIVGGRYGWDMRNRERHLEAARGLWGLAISRLTRAPAKKTPRGGKETSLGRKFLSQRHGGGGKEGRLLSENGAIIKKVVC